MNEYKSYIEEKRPNLEARIVLASEKFLEIESMPPYVYVSNFVVKGNEKILMDYLHS